tara:strand:- start:3250 stop:3690 length:441 start_codon:yes stop_codon:yes gene_type:complete
MDQNKATNIGGYTLMANLSLYGNLLSFVPNVANLPRNVFVDFSDVDAGFQYSSIFNIGRDAFCLLDTTVYNNSGGTAIVSIDTRQYWILDGAIRTLTNIPSNEFKIISTGATPNQMRVTFMGCSLDYLKNLGLGNPQAKLELGDLA